MSEPRYDFLWVTVREHNPIGYVLTGVYLVYSPMIPQNNRQRFEWCRDKGVLRDLASAFRDQIGEHLVLRADTGISQKILWDVVSVFGIHDSMVNEVKSAKLTRSQKFVPLPQTFWNASSTRRDWLFDRLKEFHKMGGGQYLLKGVKSEEVPRFAR